jgi:hypothetical protein
MKKLKMQLDELVVESFTTAAEKEGRGTVEGHVSCDTCEDLNCSANCTGVSCNTGTGTGGASGMGTICGPGGSNPNMSCFSDAPDCHTMYEWTGCDYSCEFRPC